MSNYSEFDDVVSAGCFLQSGGVLAYPSESVWGLGCDAFCRQAVLQILQLKSRSMDKGLIVLTDSAERLTPLIRHLDEDIQAHILQKINNTVQNQQAQTWLIPVCNVPKFLTGGYDKMAIRVTPHALLQNLCQSLVSTTNPYGFLVSTSCNPSGGDPAISLMQAQSYFGWHVGYLQGETLGFTKPSKIHDILTDKPIRL